MEIELVADTLVTELAVAAREKGEPLDDISVSMRAKLSTSAKSRSNNVVKEACFRYDVKEGDSQSKEANSYAPHDGCLVAWLSLVQVGRIGKQRIPNKTPAIQPRVG